MAHNTSERRRDGRAEQPLRALRSGTHSNELSFDGVFDLLSDRRRRLALHALSRRDGAVTVAEVTEQVATWERGGERPSDRHVDRVRRSLRGGHLPMLAERDLIEYADGAGEVRYLGHPVVEEYVEHVAPVDLPG